MKGVRHVGIVVTDMEKALSFYHGLLGLKIVKDAKESSAYIDTVCGMKNAIVKTVKLATDDSSLIELLHFISPLDVNTKTKGLNNIGFSHVSFTVDDIEEEYKRLKKLGVYFNSPPQFSPDGYAKVVFCRDMEGNFIELVEVLKVK
jgi:catechol 2,3-dioxygenase-like lactoylglutathione lyase family enzyme